MKYINRTTGNEISSATYAQLSEEAMSCFIREDSESKDDHLTMGDAVGLAVVTPVIIVGAAWAIVDSLF